MASPIPKFPIIIKNLKLRNFKEAVGYQQLRVEIMRETGSMVDKTIRTIIQAMSDLGYIKDSGHGAIFYLCQDKEYHFPQIKKEEISKELDNYEPEKV